MSNKREIDLISHEKFLNLFKTRHFRGDDPNVVEMKVTGYGRDYFANDRDISLMVNLFTTIEKIFINAHKLRIDGQIGPYAEMILIARSMELAFFGKHYLLL